MELLLWLVIGMLFYVAYLLTTLNKLTLAVCEHLYCIKDYTSTTNIKLQRIDTTIEQLGERR